MRVSTGSSTLVRALRPAPVTQFGIYRVSEEIGDGSGLASVHRAIDTTTGTPIALKRLRPQFAADQELLSVFLAEGQLGSQLHHEHVQQTIAYGKLDGTYFIAMELVIGPTLSQVMKQSASAAGAIPVAIVIELLLQLCSALEHLHTRPVRIIHRDVSPANILLSNTGRVKLTNLATAKTAQSRVSTGHGIIKGTLGYVAPEYTFGRLDTRADLFAIGVIAHELLAGGPLFGTAKDYATMWRVREKPIQPPSRWNPQVSRDLDDIVLTALQRDPERRWQNAGALRFALTALADRSIDAQLIRDWAEWAFSKRPHRETVLVKTLNELARID
ncbi:MAG: serine/threonine-protein kinase [Kofleriaceae bacterium]